MSIEKPARVLVVDDEIELLEISKDWLSDFNCIVESASTVEAAWAALVKNPFALVISDMNLGMGGSGTKIYELVQEHLLNPPEFIFTTGNPSEFSSFLAKNPVTVIEKPTPWAALADQIEKAIEKAYLHKTARRFVRFKSNVTASLMPARQKVNLPINVLNYSRGGALARLEGQVVKADEMVRLEFKLNNEKSVAGLSIVKWTMPDPLISNWEMAGIEFVEFTQGDEEWIEEAVQNIMV